MKIKSLITLFTGMFLSLSTITKAQSVNHEATPDKLVVVWSSDDPMVAERAALMYTHAAKTAGWLRDVTIIIWRPSENML